MTNLSTKSIAFLSLLLLLTPLALAADRSWPIHEAVDIYHGFGEFRSNRYHAGLDIRTGGRPGRKIYSPIDGYVYRVKMAYNGYGKGLYIMGDDGLIYVYGHLQDFQIRIDSTVKAVQLATKRYFMDKYYPKDSLRIKAGQLIAISGQTGAGAPHIHFEVRKTEAVPVNPLLAGFKLDDNFPPTLTRVGFQYVDSESLFPNGQRSLYWPLVSQKGGDYGLESIPYFCRPFGLLVDGFDKSRPDGIKQAIYRVKLEVDGENLYEILFDSLDFETSRSVNLNYDYTEANQGRKRVRRLFRMSGNDFKGVIVQNQNAGILAYDTSVHKISVHEVVITAEDVYGKSSQAKFELLWGPSRIFKLDSTVVLVWDTTFFYFQAPDNVEVLRIDSIVPYLNRQDQWGRVTNAEVFVLADGNLRVEAYGGAAESSSLRLVIYTQRGILTDKQFSGLQPSAPKRAGIEWEIVDGGISVRVNSQNLRTSIFYLRMFDGDQLLGSLEPVEVVTMREYLYFIPIDEKYEHITLLELSSRADREKISQMQKPVNFHLIGHKRKETVSLDGMFSILTDTMTTYGLNFIAIEKNESQRLPGEMNSDVYTVKPDYFLTRGNFDISLTMDSSARWQGLTGLCWYDDEDSQWIWLDQNSMESSLILSESQGGGQFAAIVDRRKPKIMNLNVRRDMTVRDNKPLIKFEIVDSLSGIKADTSISIYIDDQWLIPEYDPETGICFSRPYYPLADGDHELIVRLTDRAGNISRQRIKFKVEVAIKK